MRKLSFAAVVMLLLGMTGLTTPASAVPGAPVGVSAADTVVSVRHRGGSRRYALNARKKAHAYRLNSYKKARAYRLNSYKKRRAYFGGRHRHHHHHRFHRHF